MNNPIEILYFHAQVHPDEVAIQHLDHGTNYRDLLALVRKTAWQLRAAGIRPGQVVATALPRRLTWVVSLALFHEAAIGCALLPGVPVDEVLGAEHLIATEAQAGFPAGRTIRLDTAWLATRNAGPEAERPCDFPDPGSICRLVLTSGTTGRNKAVVFTVAGVQRRIDRVYTYWTSDGPEINAMGLASVGGFWSALAKLKLGATWYAFEGLDELIAVAARFGVRSLVGSPIQLADVAQRLQALSQRLPALAVVRSGGAPLSAELLELLQRQLCPNLISVYGSTEVGGVTMTSLAGHRGAVGHAGCTIPGAEVEVVDDEGRVLGAGAEGILRTRSSSMSHGYYRDPEQTVQSFRDGWFYPGDRGRLQADGSLVLAGREAEVINCGGVKIDPFHVDQLMGGFPGVVEAAAFGLPDERGVVRMAVAVVAAPGFDQGALHARLVAHLGEARAPQVYFRVARLARNDMGKVLRAALGDACRAGIG